MDYIIKQQIEAFYTYEDRERVLYTDDIAVVCNENRYGILNTKENLFLVPPDYDNIFELYYGRFVLCKNGRQGLCRILLHRKGRNFDVKIIAPCEYNSIYPSGGFSFILENETCKCFYNEKIDRLSANYDFLHPRNFHYFFAKINGQYCLVDAFTENHLFKGDNLWIDGLGHCREQDTFYDHKSGNLYFWKDGNYYPTEESYKTVQRISCLTHPHSTTFDKVYIVNNENGVGILDEIGRIILDCEYEHIEAALKLTAFKKGKKTHKTIHIKSLNLSDNNE